MITRSLSQNEYDLIQQQIKSGFTYTDANNKKHTFRPNPQLSLALYLEANTGLRIGDIVNLKLSNFKNNRLIVTEQKRKKKQDRQLNENIVNTVLSYVVDNKLSKDDNLFTRLSVKAVQKQLRIVRDYLQLGNDVSTHSLRKYCFITVYIKSGKDINATSNFAGHTNTKMTERYLKLNRDELDKLSSQIYVG